MLGRILQRLGVPGLIRPFEYYDVESNQVIKLSTSRYYAILDHRRKGTLLRA